METKVGIFKRSDNNCSRYRKMGKGTELTKIICNLHMKVLGQLTNEDDIDLKPNSSSSGGSSTRSNNTYRSNNSQEKINSNKNHHNHKRHEITKYPTVVKIPKIIKVNTNNNYNNDDDVMDVPLDLKVRLQSERVDNVKLEPDALKNSANNYILYNDDVQEFKPKSNECEVCQKQFSSCYSLQRHMRGVHRREKPHECHVCKKSFTQQSHLKKHFQTHIEEIVVTPLIFAPPPGEEDSDSIKSPSSNDSRLIYDVVNEQTQQHQNQHYFECKNCHKSFNLINNFKFHRRMCHLMRNKTILRNSAHVNRQHTSNNKKRKKLRLHQTFFACRRLQSIRRLCYKKLRKSNEFECQVRGCFSNCSNYKMYMEHVCTHSTKFRLSKSKYKPHNNIIIKTGNRNQERSSSLSPSNIFITTTTTSSERVEVNNDNFSTPLPLVMDISEPEDFLPLSGFGGLLDYVEDVQSLVPLGFPFINSVPPSSEFFPQISIPQTETPEIFPVSMDFDKGSSFQCDDCGKIFNRKFSFDRHCLIHSGHRPFSCEVCGYQFSQASHLKKHVRKHENENASTLNQNTTTTITTTTNDTTTTSNCKVQSPTAVNSVKSKITTPILKIPIRIPKIDESSKILQPNENINGNSNGGVRRSSRRRN